MSEPGNPMLDISNTPNNPLELFHRWHQEALTAVHEANAMTVAAVDAQGRPSARQVLLKQADEQGFVFYTNYKSAKAIALETNPWASLLFWWDKLERQVRIEGSVEKVSAAESDAYFASRPRASQIGAWASSQSQPISSRAELEARFEEYERQFSGQPVPRPPHWGGYRVKPERIEFWQGLPGRLHDRIIYLRTSEGWSKQRLAP